MICHIILNVSGLGLLENKQEILSLNSENSPKAEPKYKLLKIEQAINELNQSLHKQKQNHHKKLAEPEINSRDKKYPH